MADILSDPILITVVSFAVALIVGPTVWRYVIRLIPVKRKNNRRLIEQLKAVRKHVNGESAECLNMICRELFEETLK